MSEFRDKGGRFLKNHGFASKKNITESRIRHAMEHTKSCRTAAEFLNISINTYRKYAKLYIDEETGLDLYELHKNQEGSGIRKYSRPRKTSYYALHDILSGRHPEYSQPRLRKRLVEHSILAEKCSRCGFDERRIVDYAVPLLLDWIDGDSTNHRRDNLQLLCYNCYFLTVNNVAGRKINLNFLK